MKIIKKVKERENKRRMSSIDLRNTKGATWNNKRRFSI
jgi:hypothetical protein